MKNPTEVAMTISHELTHAIDAANNMIVDDVIGKAKKTTAICIQDKFHSIKKK